MAKKIAQRRKPTRKAQQPCITLKQLKQADACREAQREFRQLFGKSAPLTAATLKQVVFSKHLGLWWIHDYLKRAGAPDKTRRAFYRILDRIDTAEVKAAQAHLQLPVQQQGPQAKALAREAIQLRRQARQEVKPYTEQVQALYAQITKLEESACKIIQRANRQAEQLERKLPDAATDWRDQQTAKAQYKAVRAHLPRLAGIAGAYLHGKNLSQSEGEAAANHPF